MPIDKEIWEQQDLPNRVRMFRVRVGASTLLCLSKELNRTLDRPIGRKMFILLQIASPKLKSVVPPLSFSLSLTPSCMYGHLFALRIVPVSTLVLFLRNCLTDLATNMMQCTTTTSRNDRCVWVTVGFGIIHEPFSIHSSHIWHHPWCDLSSLVDQSYRLYTNRTYNITIVDRFFFTKTSMLTIFESCSTFWTRKTGIVGNKHTLKMVDYYMRWIDFLVELREQKDGGFHALRDVELLVLTAWTVLWSRLHYSLQVLIVLLETMGLY